MMRGRCECLVQWDPARPSPLVRIIFFSFPRGVKHRCPQVQVELLWGSPETPVEAGATGHLR
jgi:hypothetical protein